MAGGVRGGSAVPGVALPGIYRPCLSAHPSADQRNASRRPVPEYGRVMFPNGVTTVNWPVTR